MVQMKTLIRGKRTDTGAWITGDIVHDYWIGGEQFLGTAIRYPTNGIYSFPISVDESTVGQYTGLKDKNGMKIFEGDIIPYYEDDSINLIVEWSNDYLGYFVGLGLGETIEQPLFDFLYPEVIGNIHDNPELIKL